MEAPATEAETQQSVVEPVTTEQTPVRTVAQTSGKAWWENLLDMLAGSSITVIAAVVGILVLLVSLLLIIRRRRSIAEFEESILTGSALDGQTTTTETEATGTGTDTSFLSDFGMAGLGTMQADEVDPLAEAEVYLAYGRDEQAEEVLKEAAARDTGRHELKLKLLEIYQQRNDLNSFETLAEELYPAGEQGDAATWSKVVEMGLKMNPDNPLFSQEVPAVTEALTEALPASVKEALNEPAEDTGSLEDTLVEQPLGETLAEADSDDLAELSELSEDSKDLAGSLDDQIVPVGEEEEEATDTAETLAFANDSDLDEVEQIAEVSEVSDPTNPNLSPFPAPDQTAGLDEELDRLSKQMEETSASMDAEESKPQESPSGGDAEMLNFATSDPSELDFDIDLDEPEPSTGEAQAETVEAEQEESMELGKVEEGSGDEDFLNLDLEPVEDSEVDVAQAQEPGGKESDDEEFLNLDFDEVAAPQSEVADSEETRFELEPEFGDEESAVSADEEDDTEKWDEAATKLDLAQAYLNMGDKAGARSIIDEVMKEGSPAQKNQAAELAAQIN